MLRVEGLSVRRGDGLALEQVSFGYEPEQPVLQQLVTHAADHSFNSITIDGDTSTNDSFVLIATGQSGATVNSAEGAAFEALRDAVTSLAQELAQMIVRDGEGATKLMTIRVEGGKDVAECRQIAYAVAHSPLVKTAFFASDPNLGRILAAVGYAGVADLDVHDFDAIVVAGGQAQVKTELLENQGGQQQENCQHEETEDYKKGQDMIAEGQCHADII